MRYLILLLLLAGCSSAGTKNYVWEKKCYPTATYPYEKCIEYTK